MPQLRTKRSTVTAAAALAVAAVTAALTGVAIATSENTTSAAEFSTPSTGNGDKGRGDSSSAVPRPSPKQGQESSQPPRRVEIPALGVQARIIPTGITPAGNAQIPSDGDVVGWYEFGSAPGDRRGSAVLIGHRDTEAEGPGALFDLDAIEPGDKVQVARGSSEYTYKVVTLRSLDKQGLPDSLFRRGGQHQLVLITCGGPFVPEAGGYQENLFAVAVPVDR